MDINSNNTGQKAVRILSSRITRWYGGAWLN